MDLKRLRRLAREVDDQHRAAMREIHDELDSSAPTDRATRAGTTAGGRSSAGSAWVERR